MDGSNCIEDKMRTPVKKLIIYSSKNSFLREINSKLSSPNCKNVHKVSSNKRFHFKPKSRVKKIRTRKNSLNGKQTETHQKISDRSSSRSSSKLPGKKASCLSRRENCKNALSDGTIGKVDGKENLKRKKNRKKKIVQDEASCLQRRARYLLIKMKLELNLIDAYSGDGWKGQSREKIKPEKELQRAEKQILKCKLGIRDVIRQLDLLSSEGRIEDSVMYPDGSVFHEYIFCAKCKSREAFPDDDIILCDGTCNCGFHQKCLDPPLEKIPPGDQGWLCKFCECKMGILEAVNAHIGTCFTVNNNWEEIFKEAIACPLNTSLVPVDEWPSEDSEDEDYNPERTEYSNNETCIEEDVSDDASSLSSLFCSSDEFTSYSNLTKYHSCYPEHKRKNEFGSIDCIVSIDSGEASDSEITSYRRQRRNVDYKKLYDEMFGKELNENEQLSEDEDWGPHRRKRRREADDGTAMDNCGDEDGSSNMVLQEKISRDKRALVRLPSNAVEKLRQVFAENELPSRAVKEDLSKQLGISAEKVSRWFKNARYAALKTRKAEIISQPQNIARKPRTNAGKKRSDGEPSLDNSYFLPLSSLVHVPRNLRRILRKKKRRSSATPLKERETKAANTLATNKIQKSRSILVENQFPSTPVERNLVEEPGLPCSQAHTWFKYDVHLKSQVSSPGKKAPPEKTIGCDVLSTRVDEITEDEQLCLLELKRLFCIEDRLRKLKGTLLKCTDNGRVPSEPHSREHDVIYVPIAEVKEKS